MYRQFRELSSQLLLREEIKVAPRITPENNPKRTFLELNETHSVATTGKRDTKLVSLKVNIYYIFSWSAFSNAPIITSSYGFVLVLKSVISSPSLPIKYL